MDWNTIYTAVMPYVGTSGLGFLAVLLLYLFIKGRKVLNGIEKYANKGIDSLLAKWETTDNEAIRAFKKALPSNLSISIETLAKNEISALKKELLESVSSAMIDPINSNTELCRVIAKILLSDKTMPDSYKEEIASLINEKAITTETLKVELIKEDEPDTEKHEELHEILID